jgi:hypothetical protein
MVSMVSVNTLHRTYRVTAVVFETGLTLALEGGSLTFKGGIVKFSYVIVNL